MQRGCLPPGVNTDDANPIPAIRQDREHNFTKKIPALSQGDNRSRATVLPVPHVEPLPARKGQGT